MFVRKYLLEVFVKGVCKICLYVVLVKDVCERYLFEVFVKGVCWKCLL